MARYQLILAYDGTDFSGFQRQGKNRTVQQVFETALKELGWQEDSILFAGRTDAGVHASGQVVVFSLDWSHEDEILLNALNARLPADAVVQKIAQCTADFHPRYDALNRAYTYRIYHLPQPQPLLDRYAWRIWPSLKGEMLNQAAQHFIGRYDFSSFGRAMKPGSSTIREIFESRWVPEENSWQYQVKANAFLYHMVRRLVFMQVQFAKGSLTLDELTRGLKTKVIIKPGLAPANGLVLSEVCYESNHNGWVDKTNNEK